MEEVITQDEQPKKKGHGCLIAFLIFFFLLLAIAGCIYYGYRKVTSGLSQQVDLGVTYTSQDYDTVMTNAGITVTNPNELCFDCTYPTFSDPHNIDVYVSNAGVSAWIDTVNKNLSYGKLSNTQVKFSDNKAEISTLFTYQGKTYPVYASGNITKASNTTISATLSDLKVGGLDLPSGMKEYVQEALVNLANNKLEALGDTLRIDDISFNNSGLHFKGLFPSKGE